MKTKKCKKNAIFFFFWNNNTSNKKIYFIFHHWIKKKKIIINYLSGRTEYTSWNFVLAGHLQGQKIIIIYDEWNIRKNWIFPRLVGGEQKRVPSHCVGLFPQKKNAYIVLPQTRSPRCFFRFFTCFPRYTFIFTPLFFYIHLNFFSIMAKIQVFTDFDGTLSLDGKLYFVIVVLLYSLQVL